MWWQTRPSPPVYIWIENRPFHVPSTSLVCSAPTRFFADFAARYGGRHGSRYVLSYRPAERAADNSAPSISSMINPISSSYLIRMRVCCRSLWQRSLDTSDIMHGLKSFTDCRNPLSDLAVCSLLYRVFKRLGTAKLHVRNDYIWMPRLSLRANNINNVCFERRFGSTNHISSTRVLQLHSKTINCINRNRTDKYTVHYTTLIID